MKSGAEAEAKDVVFLHSATPDGQGLRVIRAREGRLEAGEVRPLKEGQPLSGGDVVRLHPRKDNPRICDVDVQYSMPTVGHAGPARVSTQAFRDNWDTIFGAKDDDALGAETPDEPVMDRRAMN